MGEICLVISFPEQWFLDWGHDLLGKKDVNITVWTEGELGG